MKTVKPRGLPSKRITPSRVIFLGLLSVLGLVALLTIILVVQTMYDNFQAHKKLSRLYDEATQRCDALPTVVIREDTYKGDYYVAYTPQHPDYKSKAKTYTNINLFSSDVVDGYFCTLEQATQKYGDLLEDSDSNYTEAQLLQQRNEITQQLIAGGTQLYRIGALPQNARLDRTVLYADLSSYQVSYTGVGSIDLDCDKLEGSSSMLGDYVTVGQDSDGDNIYYASDNDFRKWYIEKQTTECSLEIDDRLTAEQGLAMMKSITQADPAFFSKAEISRD